MKTLILIPLTLVLITLNSSCKKDIYGCMDSNAQNHSTKATKDDGSCIPPTPPQQQQIFEEQFTMTFNSSTAYNTHYPTFDYSAGDLIILENLTDPTYNYYSPMPIVTTNVVVWGEYGYAEGDIWIYANSVGTGSPFYFPNPTTFGFRALLVKKKSVDNHPDIKNMSIDEIKTLMN